ncbi:alkaline phosphatase [Aliidiomarina sedimenti]|uniref:Alkaline phosphatase n=1 Tax=Aliidiomarina sedimenti TaxID=1933879 RepID=A0ABY0C0Y8_9GAMM|nr:DUF3413 domain-containing protein [Aliidiomarina sedimenti]RUO31530.1 alkaline phosphatase [Aliidiomarina sedimenti]
MGKYQKRDRIARLISWGHWFTFTNILLCLFIGILYVETIGGTGSALGNLYLVVNWLGHFAFLPFVFFILLLFPFCMVLPYSRILRGLGALIASFGLFILLFDALFFRQYGFHLNTYSLAQMAGDAEDIFAGASFVGLVGVIFTFLLILSMQVTLANLTWKRLDRLRGHRIGQQISAAFVACFLASHMIHIWADANLYTPITQQDDLLPLSYPSTAKTLMARHGWISAETYQSQRDQLTEADRLELQYPLSNLLCSKAPLTRPTLIVAFDSLNQEQQRVIESRVNNLQPLAETAIGHTSVQSSAFEMVYSLPDIYQHHIERDQIQPAYQSTMQDYGHDVNFYHTLNWSLDNAPGSVRSQLVMWPNQHSASQPMSIVFAANQDLAAMITAIIAAERANHRIIVTALTPAAGQESPSWNLRTRNLPTIWQQFAVPLWGANINSRGDAISNQFAQISDVMPTALSGFMSCAEDFDTFAVGRDLSKGSESLPRVHSVNSRFYIFEDEQTTILERNGDLSVYNHEGELRPGATPPTPVLIDSLQELQRFGRARR